tara:strand:+ start:64 stop:378 length:315 start_codon:yes stop_codon:yes gene_type:complete
VKIDHIALQVNDIKEASEWYKSHFDANILYLDETWALLGFDNIKLALVLPNQHENHIAIEVNPEKYPNLEFKQHRDGSNYHYMTDPWGNCVELINYGRDSGENT